ncbi:MAG: Nif3-like dinuclear metal center hexameric protein [Elusimicrobiaceae bacterium]|nr:Nif3-like dinuclear metal center hexameric protein [Elusimicrobiaceae bacterium]
MTTRDKVVSAINEYLQISSVADASLNGLQVEGRARVQKIVFGVSASLELFKRAQKAGADMIVVHHGLLWGKEQALTGAFGRRVGFLLQNQISLLGYHLPLDKHPQIGHNALLMKCLSAKDILPFAEYHGQTIGFCGEIAKTTLTAVVSKLEKICGGKAVVLPFGPKQIRKVGIVSGGGWSMLPDAIAQGLDLFVTGSLDEPAQEICREGKIHCAALGHYNSEKIGVLALMEWVAEQFAVDVEFIDVKNPI